MDVIGAALRATPITVSEPVLVLKSQPQYYHPKAVSTSPLQLGVEYDESSAPGLSAVTNFYTGYTEIK